ncbi:MAG: helix-turn-helix transcriptional regulator [Coleofasciculus sp.]
MQPLPHDFLTKIARDYDLSPEQEKAFVARFSRQGNVDAIAEFLHISPNAFRTRMSHVYKKFSFGGNSPNKARKLHDFLIQKYQAFYPTSTPQTPTHEVDIDTLVQEIRQKIKPSIQKQCGTMKVLDMTQPIGLKDIYTKANILEKVIGRRRLAINELIQCCNYENSSSLCSFFLVGNLNYSLFWLFKFDFGLFFDLGLFRSLARPLTFKQMAAIESAIDLPLGFDDMDIDLKRKLQELSKNIPEPFEHNQESFKQWWYDKNESWTAQLRNVMIQHCNIGHDWQLSDSQKQLLQQYYNANKLLVDCLNSDCYISQEVRQEIEDTLLLPIAEIEKRKSHWKPGNKFPEPKAQVS